MANLIPSGIDATTGQNKELTSADTLVDASGNPLLGASPVVLYSDTTLYGGSDASETQNQAYTLVANTVSDDHAGIQINFSVRFGSGSGTPTYRLKFNGVTLIQIDDGTAPYEANGWLRIFQTGTDTAVVYAQWIYATDNAPGALNGGVRNNVTAVGANPWTTNTTIETTRQNVGAGTAGVFDRHLQVVYYPAP